MKIRFKLDVGKKFMYLLYSRGKRDKISKCAKMELILNQIILILNPRMYGGKEYIVDGNIVEKKRFVKFIRSQNFAKRE